MGWDRPSRAKFDDDLAKLMDLVRRHRAAEIDAAACGTRRDFELFHRLEKEMEDVVETFTENYAPPEQRGTRG